MTRDAVRARLGAVRRTEGIHHEHVAELRHAARQGLVVFLLALVEAHVLAQHHFARLALDAIQPIGDERYRLPEQLLQPRSHRRQRVLGRKLTLLGTAEMREQDDPRARRNRRANRRQGGTDARIARDRPGFHRHVQIFADEHPLAHKIEIGHPQHVHRRRLAQTAFAHATVVSSMRFEKPHSLSYHEHTLTRLPPMTLVIVAS